LSDHGAQQAPWGRASDWRTPEWCRAAGIHWESWSINGEVCIKGLDPPFPGGARFASCLTWLMRSFASRCRSVHDATGALAFTYASPRLPSTLASMMSIDFDLALRDPRLIAERVRRRDGDPDRRRWPMLWLEGSAYEYVIGRDPFPPTGTPRRRLVVVAEEQQRIVPARAGAPGATVGRVWVRGLDAVATTDQTALAEIMEEDELAFLANILVLVHARPAVAARPRPTLEESFRRHEGLIAALAGPAEARGLPVVWHALWRLRPAMTWSAPGLEPWMRYPAVSFVVAARPAPPPGRQRPGPSPPDRSTG
jgi:hypothetical protein